MQLARQAEAAEEGAVECTHTRWCQCVAQGYCLESFGEVVRGDEQVFVAIRRGMKARQDVDGDEVHWCTGGDLAKVAMRSTWRPPANGASFTLSAPGINVLTHAGPVVKAA